MCIYSYLGKYIFNLHIAPGHSIAHKIRVVYLQNCSLYTSVGRIQRQWEIPWFLCHNSSTRYILHLPIDARRDCVITFDHVALEFSLWHQPQIPCSSLTEKDKAFFSTERKNPWKISPRTALTVTLQYRRRNLRPTRAFLLPSAR